MRKAGMADYESFARKHFSEIKDRPISLEVFADDFAEMERQAHKLLHGGKIVYVKVPVTNTKGESFLAAGKALVGSGNKAQRYGHDDGRIRAGQVFDALGKVHQHYVRFSRARC